MKIAVRSFGFGSQERLLKRCVSERIAAEFADGGQDGTGKGPSSRPADMEIWLCVDETLGAPESYLIEEMPEEGGKEGGREEDAGEEGGEGKKIRNAWKITGSDILGLSYGIGKFLHSAEWSETGFAPRASKGVKTPVCSFRAIYFSVHFYNWYHMAPMEELEKYIEDLLLWGYNTIVLILPLVNAHSFDEPDFRVQAEKTRRLFQAAKVLGMKTGTIINPNQGLLSAPHELDADLSYDPVGNIRGWAGRNICPSKKGAMEYLKYVWKNWLETYRDIGLDYLVTWPYDEGGCGCEKCRPWGARAYCDLVIALKEEAQRLYSGIQFVVSTWIFDRPKEEGEFEGLYRRLTGDMAWVDYIMVDSHNQFPRYPLEHDVIKPVVNFPEISMYGLYSWGGRGANPLLKHFQGIWDSAKGILSGGMPYSEGLYEDISKIQCVGYYWEPDRHYRDIVGEYIGYEYSPEVCDDVIRLMELVEVNHERVAAGQEPDMEAARLAEAFAEYVDGRLSSRAKGAWRWRILYIRTKIDRMAYEYYAENCRGKENALQELKTTREYYLRDNEEAQELLQELCGIYHTVDRNGSNGATFPPVKDGKVLQGKAR